MGMSIEKAHGILSNGLVNAPSEHEWCMAFKMAIDTMRKYQMMQADYKNRLKADLEQLDSEIQEQIAFMGDGEETNGMKRADKLVKDKINALKQSIWQDNYNGKKETNNG